MHQDIRPLKIVIVNLMPTKIATETQLLRLLSNSPLQIEIDFLQMDTHASKNTPSEHLATFYTTFDEIKDAKLTSLQHCTYVGRHLPVFTIITVCRSIR